MYYVVSVYVIIYIFFIGLVQKKNDNFTNSYSVYVELFFYFLYVCMLYMYYVVSIYVIIFNLVQENDNIEIILFKVTIYTLNDKLLLYRDI